MPTIEQIRAARALIGWSQGDLADRSDLSQTGVARIENGSNQPNSTTLDKIISAFDKADIEFIGDSGVKKRTGDIKKLKGKQGFIDFMNDVYETSKNVGGEICVFNVDEKNWIKWMGQDRYDSHASRMKKIEKDINFKIIVEENDWFFIATKIAEYKWFPKELFNEQSFYIYGKKIAFINFLNDDVRILMLEQPQFTDGLRVLFDIAWNQVAKTPEKEA